MMSKSGKLTVIVGASQYGKTTLFHKMTEHLQRFVVYDPKCHPDDYPGVFAYETIHDMAIEMLNAQGNSFRARLLDDKMRDFHSFCDAALDWGKRFGKCAVGIDELAEVTNSGKARDAYGTLIRTGKGFGIDIFCMTQALNESDKSCLRNSDIKICFYLGHIDDRKYMAKQIGVKEEQINALPPYKCIIKEHLKPAYLFCTTSMKACPLPG